VRIAGLFIIAFAGFLVALIIGKVERFFYFRGKEGEDGEEVTLWHVISFLPLGSFLKGHTWTRDPRFSSWVGVMGDYVFAI
jgi:hypothetical protein